MKTITALCCVVLALTWGALSAKGAVIITLSGTYDAPIFSVTVDNSDSFSSVGHILSFFLPPNAYDVEYGQEGPLGNVGDGVQFRASTQAVPYLNVVMLGTGDFSNFTLNATNPYMTSGDIMWGNVASMAVLDGVTSTMNLLVGTGPASTAVTFNFTAIPEPSSILLLVVGVVLAAGMLRRRDAGCKACAETVQLR